MSRASNRQIKLLKFFGVAAGPNASIGAAGMDIESILADPGRHELWLKYLYHTGDFDVTSPEPKATIDEVRHIEVPEGWTPDGAEEDFMDELVGGIVEDAGPFDKPVPEIKFPGRSFMMTGRFEFGKRVDCEAAIEDKGGEAQDDPNRDLDYLVVGGKGSKHWARGNYGRKIEYAIMLRRETGKPAIVSEADWRKALEG